MLITVGLMLVAFTVGLVLEPSIARRFKKRAELRHSRKVGSAIVLLESQGYTVKWTPKDVSGWGWTDPEEADKQGWV